MGQKTDARIFRQGINKKNWELKHVEKTLEESSLYLYKTLEVQKDLNRFFGLYKIKIHSCKIFYSESSLQVSLSFYVTAKTIYLIHIILVWSAKCIVVFALGDAYVGTRMCMCFVSRIAMMGLHLSRSAMRIRLSPSLLGASVLATRFV